MFVDELFKVAVNCRSVFLFIFYLFELFGVHVLRSLLPFTALTGMATFIKTLNYINKLF